MNSEQYRPCSEACTEIPGATGPTRGGGRATQRREPFQLSKDETSLQVTRQRKCEDGRRVGQCVCTEQELPKGLVRVRMGERCSQKDSGAAREGP